MNLAKNLSFVITIANISSSTAARIDEHRKGKTCVNTRTCIFQFRFGYLVVPPVPAVLFRVLARENKVYPGRGVGSTFKLRGPLTSRALAW